MRYQIRDSSGQAVWGTPAQPYSRATIGQPLRFEDIEQVAPGNDYVLVKKLLVSE